MRSVEEAFIDYERDIYVKYLKDLMSSSEASIYKSLLGEDLPFVLAGISFDFKKEELIFTATKDPQVVAAWRNRIGNYLALYTRAAYPEF